jgi:hypothetical protein
MVGFLCLDSNLLIDIDREIQTKIPFLSAQLGRLRVDITIHHYCSYPVIRHYGSYQAIRHYGSNSVIRHCFVLMALSLWFVPSGPL